MVPPWIPNRCSLDFQWFSLGAQCVAVLVVGVAAVGVIVAVVGGWCWWVLVVFGGAVGVAVVVGAVGVAVA